MQGYHGQSFVQNGIVFRWEGVDVYYTDVFGRKWYGDENGKRWLTLPEVDVVEEDRSRRDYFNLWAGYISNRKGDDCVSESDASGQGGGGSDIVAQLFGKYNAGYIADANSNRLFPNQKYDRDKVVTRYMVEGVGVWTLGMVNTGLGAVSGGLAVTFQGQEHILRMKAENYLQNGQGLGIYVINVSAPGAFPRAMLFNAVDGSSIGWHHTTVQGAPTMPYHIYLKFLKGLNTIR